MFGISTAVAVSLIIVLATRTGSTTGECDQSLYYGNCSKVSNTFLFLFSSKVLVIRAGIHGKLVKIANREDPDQIASSEAV